MNERMAASCPKSVTLTKGEHQDGKGVGTTNELLLFLPQARATQKGCGFSGEVASEQSDDFAERMIYLTSFDVCYFVSFFFWLVFWECHLFFGLCFFLLFLFWSILQVYLSQTSDEPILQLNAAWRATNYLHQKIIYKILRAIGHSSIKSIRHGQNSQRISPTSTPSAFEKQVPRHPWLAKAHHLVLSLPGSELQFHSTLPQVCG